MPTDEDRPSLYQLFVDMKIENASAHKNIVAKLDMQNGRVSKLERWRSYLLGAFTTISAILVSMLLLRELTAFIARLNGA